MNKEINQMNVIEIPVPEEIEYISEWQNFQYPLGHLILDKTICGCGFTEYCLNNNIPTVLCSPRKKLLENKEEQHNSGENINVRPIYYFRNDGEQSLDFDCSISNEKIKLPFELNETTDKKELSIKIQSKVNSIQDKERQAYLTTIKNNLRSYINSCNPVNNPFKIIVTYDSLHHVLGVLNEYYSSSSYAIVVDEFQSIFMDSSFKAEVELDFVEDLKGCANVLYLSATPMLEKYLVQLDTFKSLPMYKLIWPDSRIEHVRVERKITQNINKELGKYITDYREGRYPNKILSDGTLKESKELVIFVNSIKSICDIIKKNSLKPEETNIICSETDENLNKLKKVGHTFGNIPTYGQPHKMFTLCTRTTYLGADFYSTCAYTIICSDCNIKTLTVDISLDLPQIIGRQRLKENIFRNEVLFLYKARTKQDASINITEEQFKREIDARDLETREMLKGYNSMTDFQRKLWAKKAADAKNLYRSDYIGISKRTGEATYNYLVKVAHQRAFDVSRKEYQDDVTIKRGIESIGNARIDLCESVSINDLQGVYQYFFDNFDIDNNFERRMKLLCDIYFQYPTFYTQYSLILQIQVPLNYQNYINLLGFERIRALGYYEAAIIEEARCVQSNTQLDISAIFIIGSKYSKAQIKEMLRKFYEENNITKTPKASDLEEYFNLKTCKIKINDKWENGFLIISEKGD